MKIMVINSGGSSIKYEIFDFDDHHESSLCRGTVKRLYRNDSYWEQFKPNFNHNYTYFLQTQ